MIYEFSNLIDENLCDRLIEYFEHSQIKNEQEVESFFYGRTVCFHEIKDITLRKKLEAFVHRVIQKSYVEYQEFIFLHFCNIVKWHSGMNMNAHVDNGIPELNMRHYTSICYLNDDYDGGETFLPEHKYTCAPKKGKVLIFPSHYPHGVNLIKNNSRYTLAMWFTKNDEHIME